MNKSHNGNVRNLVVPTTHFTKSRSWLADKEPFGRIRLKTFDEAADDQRLKFALKRALSNTDAPQYLIDSIREKIRES